MRLMGWKRSALGARVQAQPNSWVISLIVLLLCACPNAAAKCPVASVTVKGHVVGSAGQKIMVSVELVTPKGHFRKETSTEGADFSLLVAFPTESSYSPLWGHRCNNHPETVMVTAGADGKIFAQKKLSFQRDFESSTPNEYRLRSELTLDTKREPESGGGR